MRLGDGSAIDADVVVVGVGVVPETGWLEGSGLTLDNGVVCDETCLAAPGIVAAGDVARWPNPLFDGAARCGSSTGRTRPSRVCTRRARLLAGDDDGEPFAPVPFVWSDQYDRKIQTVGVVSADADVHVAHGTLAERQFVALFGRGGRLVGALGFNRPRQVMQYRRIIAERALVGRRARSSPTHERDDRLPTRPRIVTAAVRARRRERALLLHRARDAHAGAARTTSRSRSGTAASRSAIAVGAFAVGAIAAAAVRGPDRRPRRPARS